MQHLIVATRNAHKTREIQRILGADFAVCDLSAHPGTPETAETGKTFEENAVLKATVASRQLPGLVVADDSGLEVDALGGAPGIYSARYAGQNATDKQNIDKLLEELARIETAKRSARFRCVIALAREGKLLGAFEGVVEGMISILRAARAALVTIRFLFRKSSNKRSVNCPPKLRIESATVDEQFASSPIGFRLLSRPIRAWAAVAGHRAAAEHPLL